MKSLRPQFRVSISGLMATVFAFAILFAALRAESALWASAVYTMLLISLMTSAVGLFCRRGRRRAFWAGFAIFAGSYTYLSFGPWAHQGVRPPALWTTNFLFYWELGGKCRG